MHVDAMQINLNPLVNSCCFFSIDTDTDILKIWWQFDLRSFAQEQVSKYCRNKTSV